MNRKNLYQHNKQMVKKSTTGSVKFVLVYDKNGKAHDCWDRPDLQGAGFIDQLRGLKTGTPKLGIICYNENGTIETIEYPFLTSEGAKILKKGMKFRIIPPSFKM